MHKNHKVLGVFAITAITIAGIFTARTLPIMAKYGFASTFYYIVAALLFFIPSALACAELATGWPKKGGAYAWVSAAFGSDAGFLTVWLEWVNTVVSFPMNLAFIAATFAYVLTPSLAQNKTYMVCMMLAVFWSITAINFFGIKVSSVVSAIGMLLGTMLPTALIIILGLSWWLSGHPLQIHFGWHSFIPDFHFGSAVLLVGVILGYAGMQVAAFHIHETKNPQKDFPKALAIAAVAIIVASILGSLAIAMVVPVKSISLVTGIMQAVYVFFGQYHLQWLVPVIAFLMVLGTGASLNTWLIAPAKGLQASVTDGHLPQILRYTNNKGVPVAILLVQAVIATLLALLFLYMPTVSSSYWLLTALTAILTFIMDILIFGAVIRLRYKEPNTTRSYKIPGGMPAVWLICGVGILVCIFGIILGFTPPVQLKTGNDHFYRAFLIGGVLVLACPALFMSFTRKLKS